MSILPELSPEQVDAIFLKEKQFHGATFHIKAGAKHQRIIDARWILSHYSKTRDAWDFTEEERLELKRQANFGGKD